jgi:hypothetical protein
MIWVLFLLILQRFTNTQATDQAPLYPRHYVSLLVEFPRPSEVIHGTVLYVQWSFSLFGEKAANEFNENNHDRSSCMRVREYPSGVTVADNHCRHETIPKLLNIPSGNMVLEIYAIDRNIPPAKRGHVLTVLVQVPFTAIHRNNVSGISLLSQHSPAKIPQHAHKLLRSSAWPISYHRIISSQLKQWYRDDAGFRNAMIADTKDPQKLHRLLFQPKLKNDWENIVRASMHGRMLPILAHLPLRNVVWWKVNLGEEMLPILGNIRTLNEDAWKHEAEGRAPENPGCNTLQERKFHDPPAHDTIDTSQHHVLMAFAKSWNNLENLILMADAQRAKVLWEQNASKVVLFVGTSPDFDMKTVSSLCAISEMPEQQRLTLLDGGPLYSEIHGDQRSLPSWMI